MKVVLFKDVPNLGDAGDIKEVANGYARNYLFPKKLAVRADEGNTKTAVHQKKLAELKKEKRKKEMKSIASSLEGKVIEIPVKTGANDKLFGSVTAIDVAKAVSAQGVEIEKRKIEIPEHIKALGDYKIKIKLADGILANVVLKVVKEGGSSEE
ncbi:MAG: 50S ribosomal protein L9 [Leptospiraceae bacterium]|nr:50S ribosomal protein L9 [Leptospiraceae bacterium]MCP5503443.1 50S ribosomal protein L9 [Leptospiraceae bacterium]